MSKQKKVLITFLGNIDYDTRSFNLFDSFRLQGYDVEFVGFDWLTNDFKQKDGKQTVYKLSKSKFSLLFYLKFYFLLLSNALRRNYDIIFAEDLYCFPVCYIAAKIKNVKVVYDCRELFSFLAGLKNKAVVQKLWAVIENLLIRKADIVLSTGEMDSDFLKLRYNIKNVTVLRNLPLYKKDFTLINYYELLNFSKDKKILLYQGIILHGRGLKLCFDFLKISDDFILVIIGGGEMLNYYKKLSVKMNIENKVFFVGKIEQSELINYTASAFIGLALIENISLSYYYALPNKLFEYIMAGVPVIATNLPQMKNIIDKYKVGFAIEENIQSLTDVLNKMRNDEKLYNSLKENCVVASKELCWENEIRLLLDKL